MDTINLFNNSGGRNIYNGPTYANWGGKDWSGGQTPSQNNNEMGNKRPADSIDFCAMRHDQCWKKCSGNNKQCVSSSDENECKNKCDFRSKMCSLQLDSKDPRNWPVPPTPGTEGHARYFQHGMIYLGGKNYFRN